MAIRVYLLMGGLFSFDGYVTSPGMLHIKGMVQEAIPEVIYNTYLWGDFQQCYTDLMAHQEDKLVVIGYSGGGTRATWIANGYGVNRTSKPKIDLMVLYDPSPSWQMLPILDNVKKAVCFENQSPWMFGLGGGVLHGRNVETVPISMQHLAVQASGRLHDRTLELIKELAEDQTP